MPDLRTERPALSSKSRLFFALWPDAQVRMSIAQAGQDPALDAGRRIPPENLHLTLLFIGAVDPGQRDQLLQAAARISVSHFSLLLDRSGNWRPAQVAWLVPDHVPDELQLLHDRLRSMAGLNGLLPETRPYRPHVTLAKRITVPINLEFEPISWRLTQYCLAESLPQSGYVKYRIIGHWPLT